VLEKLVSFVKMIIYIKHHQIDKSSDELMKVKLNHYFLNHICVRIRIETAGFFTSIHDIFGLCKVPF
jgi:hypothetical protein